MINNFSPRQITFAIPGKTGVIVTATENGLGALEFSVVALPGSRQPVDLRSLFFDFNESKLFGLSITSNTTSIMQSMVRANSVLDLGMGANLRGATRDGFDVGLGFGFAGKGKGVVSGPVTFTLSNKFANLTLDDIADQRFGARTTSVGDKAITLVSAAPDAQDDAYTLFEDNSAGLGSPSKEPVSYRLNVLANDADADGDPLVITSIDQQPAHGTISIIENGKALLYTPQTDFAGQISFRYGVSDGTGGQDNATAVINLTAVADAPVLDVEVSAVAGRVDQVLISVRVDQNDADSSEFIDSLVASGLPFGATLDVQVINPTDQPDFIEHTFLLTLTEGQDYDFDLVFTATSQETSNGDQQIATQTVAIGYEYNETTVAAQFTATDRSIWSDAAQFTFEDKRFLGVDTSYDGKIGDDLYAGIDLDLKVGFQSELIFEGGEINSTADYDITVATNFNKTIDALQISTGALLTGALFDTEGPEGSYTLDFLYDIFLSAYVGAKGIGEEELLGIDSANTINLIDLNSEDIGLSYEFPAPFNSVSLDLAWPSISTQGSLLPNPGVATGASNNFLQLNLDLDTLLTQLLKVPNIFDPEGLDIGVASADPDLLDLDVFGGLNFIQDFQLFLGELEGALRFENGDTKLFSIGDEIFLNNASLIDVDSDGLIEFDFTLSPDAELTNSTSLGFNIGFHVKVLEVTGHIVGIDYEVGPLYENTWTLPIAQVEVFKDNFGLAYGSETFAFAA